MDPDFLLNPENIDDDDEFVLMEQWVIANYPKLDDKEVLIVTDACLKLSKFYADIVIPREVGYIESIMLIRSLN